MKIVIVTNTSAGLYGFRKELIYELAKKNEVIALSPNNQKKDELMALGCQLIDTPLDRRTINPVTDLKLVLLYQRLLKKIKPDLVITYTIKPNIYGGFVSRIQKIPYAVNITGIGTAFQKEGLLKKIVTIMYKVALKNAKVVFFENAENRNIFLDAKIVKQQQCCLLNGAGVNLKQYKLQEYPKCENGIHFLFIGRVMQEKGINELFEAMRRIHKENNICYLDVVGSFEENYSEVMEQGEKEGWLKYHGYQSDVRPFIANAHCFVLPSWHEGMANTNLECAASGRPIITSNIHGCKEAVIENISGLLCEPKNADSLYNAMKRFLDLSQEERINMGRAGRKHMEEVFDKKKVVMETVKRLFD